MAQGLMPWNRPLNDDILDPHLSPANNAARRTMRHDVEHRTPSDLMNRIFASLAIASCLCLMACATTPTTNDQETPDTSPEKPQADPPKEGEDFYKLPDTIPAGAPVVEGGASGVQVDKVEMGEAPPVDLAEVEFAIKRKQLDAFLAKGPAQALRALQVQPAFEGSRFVGYEIVRIPSQASSPRVLGRFLPGDIIVSVNGQSIARPEDYMSVWNKLSQHHQITMALLRQGQHLDLVWPIIE